MRTLNLDRLKGGMPEISPSYGAFLAEAAAVCLSNMGHQPGVQLRLEGDFNEVFLLIWTQEIGEVERLSWSDSREATEYGAVGIALLLLLQLTNFQAFVRNEQGEGFDFFLYPTPDYVAGSKDASLEVSGILKEVSGNTINARVLQKEKRLTSYGNQNLTNWIVVVEFSLPKAKITIK